MNLIKGALVGGVIAFAWGWVSWMVLPWHMQTFHKFKDADLRDVILYLGEFAKLNVARAEHTARKLNNGNVLVAGGTTTNELSDSGADYTSTLELIDIQNKSATLIGQMRQSRAIPMLEPIGIDKCIIRHGKFLDTNNNPTEAKLPMNLEAWEIYTGKTTKSYRRPYPMQSWLWCLSNTLHKK